jgi:hypothetical protein
MRQSSGGASCAPAAARRGPRFLASAQDEWPLATLCHAQDDLQPEDDEAQVAEALFSLACVAASFEEDASEEQADAKPPGRPRRLSSAHARWQQQQQEGALSPKQEQQYGGESEEEQEEKHRLERHVVKGEQPQGLEREQQHPSRVKQEHHASAEDELRQQPYLQQQQQQQQQRAARPSSHADEPLPPRHARHVITMGPRDSLPAEDKWRPHGPAAATAAAAAAAATATAAAAAAAPGAPTPPANLSQWAFAVSPKGPPSSKAVAGQARAPAPQGALPEPAQRDDARPAAHEHALQPQLVLAPEMQQLQQLGPGTASFSRFGPLPGGPLGAALGGGPLLRPHVPLAYSQAIASRNGGWPAQPAWQDPLGPARGAAAYAHLSASLPAPHPAAAAAAAAAVMMGAAPGKALLQQQQQQQQQQPVPPSQRPRLDMLGRAYTNSQTHVCIAHFIKVLEERRCSAASGVPGRLAGAGAGAGSIAPPQLGGVTDVQLHRPLGQLGAQPAPLQAPTRPLPLAAPGAAAQEQRAQAAPPRPAQLPGLATPRIAAMPAACGAPPQQLPAGIPAAAHLPFLRAPGALPHLLPGHAGHLNPSAAAAAVAAAATGLPGMPMGPGAAYPAFGLMHPGGGAIPFAAALAAQGLHLGAAGGLGARLGPREHRACVPGRLLLLLPLPLRCCLLIAVCCWHSPRELRQACHLVGSCKSNRTPAACCAEVHPYLEPGQLGAPGTIPAPFLGPTTSAPLLGGAALPLVPSHLAHELGRTQLLELHRYLEHLQQQQQQQQQRPQPQQLAERRPAAAAALGPAAQQLPSPGPKVGAQAVAVEEGEGGRGW